MMYLSVLLGVNHFKVVVLLLQVFELLGFLLVVVRHLGAFLLEAVILLFEIALGIR